MFLRSTYVLGLLATIGCGTDPGTISDMSAQLETVTTQQTSDRAQLAINNDAAAVTPTVPEGRKIIFRAQLRINVSDFGEAAVLVDRLVTAHSGFVTASQRGGRSGTTRSGQWTLRVPVDEYRPLIADLIGLGELLDHQESSQEMTDEFYDLEARIKNKQQQEQRLLAHLDETAHNLQEILTIEGELGRVRGEVERMQGRLRLLADQTSLSTINLTLAEIETFVPTKSPSFATRIDRAWQGSVASVTSLLQWATITVVGMAPWLAILAMAMLLGLPPAIWMRRRLVRHSLKA